MTELQLEIQAMADADAQALLHRFVRAFSAGTLAPEAVHRRSQEMARSISLTADPTPPMAPGDVARSALLLLAGDARHEALLRRLQSLGEMPVARDAQLLDAAELLIVLEMLWPPSRRDSSGASMLSSANTDGAPHAAASAQPGLLRALTRQMLDYAGLRPVGPQSDAIYRVWYATSRRLVDAADPAKGFGTDRDDRIHHGCCDVFIPRSHKVGSVGSAWWKRLATGADDRMRVLDQDAMTGQAFWRDLRKQLADCAIDDRDAVVFIHGFNVTFEQAALRAAQIGFDLQIKGVMAFYSWASRGEVAKYPADEASVELDERPIADFLCELVRCSGARRVHVIAHSMGNRALLRAVNQIAQQAQRRSGARFGQIILAAPDVDARKFAELCDAYRQVSERTTLYVSSRDAAVEASAWLHDFPRAGLMPPVTVAPGIDTVNAVNADVTLLGHGYVAEARDVIGDIHALIRHGSAPKLRFGLREAATPAGEPYWLIGG